jgi:hypothetical protein
LAQATSDTSLWDVLSNKYLVALAAALFGFFFSTLLEWRKNRKLPHKQLSWDAQVDSRLVEIESSMAGQILVTYAGKVVENLTSVIYRVTNTGNSVIKNQFLRFTFPERSKILKVYLDPEPEPELAVTEVTDAKKSREERRFELGHLEVGQSVQFRFLSDGGDWGTWTGVHPFNAEGNVDFQRRDVARVRADQEHVRPFFMYLVLLLTLPPFISLSILPLTDVARLAIALALIGLLIPHLAPVARLTERMVVSYFDRTRSAGTTNGLRDADGNVVQAGSITGDVYFQQRPQTESESQPSG